MKSISLTMRFVIINTFGPKNDDGVFLSLYIFVIAHIYISKTHRYFTNRPCN